MPANPGLFAALSPGNVIDICYQAGIPHQRLSQEWTPGSNSSCEAAKSLPGYGRPGSLTPVHDARARELNYVMRLRSALFATSYAALPVSPECAGRRAWGDAMSQGCPKGAIQEAVMRQTAYDK